MKKNMIQMDLSTDATFVIGVASGLGFALLKGDTVRAKVAFETLSRMPKDQIREAFHEFEEALGTVLSNYSSEELAVSEELERGANYLGGTASAWDRKTDLEKELDGDSERVD